MKAKHILKSYISERAQSCGWICTRVMKQFGAVNSSTRCYNCSLLFTFACKAALFTPLHWNVPLPPRGSLSALVVASASLSSPRSQNKDSAFLICPLKPTIDTSLHPNSQSTEKCLCLTSLMDQLCHCTSSDVLTIQNSLKIIHEILHYLSSLKKHKELFS